MPIARFFPQFYYNAGFSVAGHLCSSNRHACIIIIIILGARHSVLGTRLSALGTRRSALGTRRSVLGARHSALDTRHHSREMRQEEMRQERRKKINWIPSSVPKSLQDNSWTPARRRASSISRASNNFNRANTSGFKLLLASCILETSSQFSQWFLN